MPTSQNICREILRNGAGRNPPIGDISPMKLIKLAFLSYGFYMAYTNKLLFNDDIEAWRYGPVIPSIYHAVKYYRNEPVKSDFFDEADDTLDDDAKEVINAVMNTYGRFGALELSTITHMKGSPWEKTVKEKGVDRVISDLVIHEYYKGMLDEAA